MPRPPNSLPDDVEALKAALIETRANPRPSSDGYFETNWNAVVLPSK
jgi:hypothetical protein